MEDSTGYVLCLPKMSLSAGCSKRSNVEKGLSGSKEEELLFMASVIPATLQPFVIISFPAVDLK